MMPLNHTYAAEAVENARASDPTVWTLRTSSLSSLEHRLCWRIRNRMVVAS